MSWRVQTPVDRWPFIPACHAPRNWRQSRRNRVHARHGCALESRDAKRPRKLAPPGSSVRRVRGVDRHLIPTAAALSRKTGLLRLSSLPLGAPRLTRSGYSALTNLSSHFLIVSITTASRPGRRAQARPNGRSVTSSQRAPSASRRAHRSTSYEPSAAGSRRR